MIDDKIALFKLLVMITIKRGTRAIQARNEIPGYGKARFISNAEKRDNRIHNIFPIKLLLSGWINESEVLLVAFIKRS